MTRIERERERDDLAHVAAHRDAAAHVDVSPLVEQLEQLRAKNVLILKILCT